MPKSLQILVDTTHNNLLTPTDPDFTDFFEMLKSKGYTVSQTRGSKLMPEDLSAIHLLILGVPENVYLLQEEIRTILDFVRGGGGLLVIHRYGGDLIQKTDLNELSSHFGIYFENTIVRDTNHAGVDLLPILNITGMIPILKGVHKIILAGSCSLRLAKDAKLLIHANPSSWLEIYNPNNYNWTKEENKEMYTLCAYSTYGQGRILTLGTSEMLSNNQIYGLLSLDNQKLTLNLLNWLTQPVSESEVRDWMLTQIGSLAEEVNHMTVMMGKFQNSMDVLEHRLSDLEHKYYASKGIHLPISEEDKA